MSLRYFLLDASHSLYSSIEQVCAKRHNTVWPLNILSVVFNDSRTKALIKVDGVDSVWALDNNIDKVSGLVMDIFQPIDHFRALQILQGAEWSNTRTPVGAD